MGWYVEVALPVPLERLFTYQVEGGVPPVGARVVVPFSGQKLVGIVVSAHDRAPSNGMTVKVVEQMLDNYPFLPAELMQLAQWIARYYVAPLGEVLRAMSPVSHNVAAKAVYRITALGSRTLFQGAERGSSRRSRLTPKEQTCEYAILNALQDGEPSLAAALRSTGATKSVLSGMVRKRWLSRELRVMEQGDSRSAKIAVLVDTVPPAKLSTNQTELLVRLKAAGGRMTAREITASSISRSTLSSLIKRGLVKLEEVQLAHTKLSTAYPYSKNVIHEGLNEAQSAALDSVTAALVASEFKSFLLFGVTGSGKTAVYLAAIRRALDEGKSALLLVPEITLTPAITAQLYGAFGHTVALLHSQLGSKERTEQWNRIRSGQAKVVLGTRSAVFAPMPDLGLIVVDEEHDSSYKQEETPRYHGRDVAVMRAKLLDIPILLGSATPSLESWQNSEAGRYTLLRMEHRVANRPLPALELVDMRSEFRETGSDQLFSRRLVNQIQLTLEAGQQAMILLNRRGYSRIVLCRACGERIECENCAVAMTLHRSPHDDQTANPAERLECHYCGFVRSVPVHCPVCQSEHLHSLGAGSQQGEELLQQLFPAARIGRMDRDAVRGRVDMERILEQLHSGEINLLVGTQMLAKGHDIHGVTTVGVVGFDHALSMPNFRAAERVFQLLTQVSGRAGRGNLPGRVLVQTYYPDHYAVRRAVAQDFLGFVRQEAQFRRSFHYPPFGIMTNVLVRSSSLDEVITWSHLLREWFRISGSRDVQMIGPAAAPIIRVKQIFRYHFMFKALRRADLQTTLRRMLTFADARAIPRHALILDVDPLNLM